jgi:hypothetical protein
MEPAFPSSLEEIEVSLAQIANASGSAQHVFDPTSVNNLRNHVLYESTLLHWVLTTWHHVHQTFRIAFAGSEKQILQQLSLSLPGKALALLPPGKITPLSKQANAILREQILRVQQNWPDLAVLNSASLICVDEQPESFPRQLYRDEAGSLVSWEEFLLFLEQLLKFVTDEASVRAALNKRLYSLCTILFELFKNTDEHAKTWISGEQFSSSLRGIHCRYYPAEDLRQRFTAAAVGDPDQIAQYCIALLRSEDAAKKNRLRAPFTLLGALELTVFDAGPGLAQRWLRGSTAQIPIREEYEAVMQCFRKGYSSASDASKGYGLWKVLWVLRELRGFIRIRTNRIHLYREFHRGHEYRLRREGEQVIPQEQLFDWNRGLTASVSPYAPTRGAVISVVLPIFSA